MFFKKLNLALLLILPLAACQTTSEQVGSGPIELRSNVISGFKRFVDAPGAGYFAVSGDGRTYGYSYCSAGLDSCQPGMAAIAITTCQKRAVVPCKIYAKGRFVIWDGPVSGVGVHKDGKQSNDVVCAYALDYSADAPAWSKQSSNLKYVTLAKQRDLTVEQCDAIN